MKAAYITAPGPPENIIYGDLPTPTLAPRQALVKVGAVSVNPIDIYIRAGMVSMPLPMPFVIGCDLAGTVESVGPGATRFRAGDRVWGTAQGLLGRQGTFAEYAAVDEEALYPTPPNVSDAQAAAVALVAMTAQLGLVRDARLQPGEIVFVNGGAGGVGSMVTQLALAFGAQAITTVGSEEKAAKVRSWGAQGVINYRTENVDERVRALAPAGVNVYWETLREPNFDRAIGLLAPRGRMILMAGREARVEFPVGPFYLKGLSLHGFAMFNATTGELRAASVDINRFLASGQLRANIDRVLPLSAAAEAHRLQAENTLGKVGTLAGKIVLTP